MSVLKTLRAISGAPIVECKKALEAVVKKGDNSNIQDKENDKKVVEDAMDWLRQHGAAKASSKVADRETTEGLVSFAMLGENEGNPSQSMAALVKVSSETDFAGRSETFVNLVEHVTTAILPNSSLSLNDEETNSTIETSTKVLTKEDISNTPSKEDGKTVQDLMDEAIVSIRENISVAEAIQLRLTPEDVENGAMWVGYVHNRVHHRSSAGTAAAAVLVAPSNENSRTQSESSSSSVQQQQEHLVEVAKKLAMHVVAARPRYLSSTDIPKDVLDKERDILQQQIVDSGKPPEIAAKIVNGRLQKFCAEICMMDQGHMVEEKNPKISNYLKEKGVILKEFQAMFIK